MKPESKSAAATRRRTNDENGASSTFNLRSLKHAIEAIDDDAKENSINLSSLAAALSVASREMKQREKSQRRGQARKKKKKKEKKNEEEKNKNKKKLVIGTKPETHAELQRWLSILDKSLLPRKFNKTLRCELNTDFTMNLCAEAFRYY